MVRLKGLEPSRELPHSDLNAARLPIPPQPHDLVERRIDDASERPQEGPQCFRGLFAAWLRGHVMVMVDWITTDGLVPYPEALTRMEARADAIARGEATEAIWLLEHPPLYTAGTSANPLDLREPDRFPVFEARRGGQYTYHGPGQRVIYTMLDLNKRGRDVRAFVCALEGGVIEALAEFGVRGERRPGRVGIWVARPEKAPNQDGQAREDKIAAIGIRLRRWVSFHGVSINLEPDLSHFDGIVPCGIREHGVTSLVDLGLPVTMGDLDAALMRSFGRRFPD